MTDIATMLGAEAESLLKHVPKIPEVEPASARARISSTASSR